MDNVSGWQDRSLSPAPDPYKNYLRTPPPVPATRPFSAWTVASLATLLGTVVSVGLALFLGFAGFMLALVMGLSGAGTNTTERAVILVIVVVVAAIVLVRIAVEAGFIRRRGGSQPVVASIASVAAGWTVVLLGSLFQLPTLLLWVLPAIVEIVVLAKVLQSGRNV